MQLCSKVQTKYIIIITIVIVLSASAEPKFDASSKNINLRKEVLGISNKWLIDYNLLLNKWTQDFRTPKTTIVPSVEAAVESDNNNNASKIGGQVDSGPGLGQQGVAVDSYPIGVAVNPVTKKVYVTNEFSNTLSVISGLTDSIANTITVGNFPYGVAVNPFNDRVYVTNRGSNTISVIDGPTNTKLSNVVVGNSPVGIGVNPSSNWIYVANINSGTVSVIDGITNKVTDTIPVGKAPYGVAVNPITNKIYVTNIESNTLSVIDGKTNRVYSTITVGKSPVGVSADTRRDVIYVTNHLSNTVSVIDGRTSKVSTIITVGKRPVGVSTNPVTNKVYVTNIQSSTVSVIDGITNKVITTIIVNPTLRRPQENGDPVLNMPILARFPLIASLVAVNSVSNLIYVTNTGSDIVSIIDGNKDSVIVRVTFNVNPPNVGDLECNGQPSLSNSSIRISNGTGITCTANSSHGYTFSSWSGLVDGSAANPIHFTASQYGTLRANFKQTLSLEQYLAIILGPVSVISIIISWFFRNRQRKYLNKYLMTISNTYDLFYKNGDGKHQEYLLRLDKVRKEVTQLYIKGRISDGHYNVLDKVICEYIGRANQRR
ncbi:MAG: beta-propeller fold lactonase family protein [Nitrososphaeraceae archaeon]|nr:beta-propeller fold lactonase family protein [Nitrososphaeraceae archaeon]